MSRSLRQLTESQIRKAEAEGKLRNLEGEGKPLPNRPGERGAEAVGLRIMAEAGVVPEEFGLKQELDAARARWHLAAGTDERRALMARIAELEMRYEMAREARRAFLR